MNEDESVPDETTRTTSTTGDELSDDEAAALGLASICCCTIFFVGLVVFIVWLVKRTSRAAQQQPAPAAAAVAGRIQLSIFALALEPDAREVVEQQLARLDVSPIPTTPAGRGRLVREAAGALLSVQSSWRQFGYGEKPGIPDLASAETSYRSASQDFRSRAMAVGTAGGDAGLVVLTLLICCRRPLLGVSRLDDPLQVRNVLEDRMRVRDDELLGTELLWAPTTPGGRISEAEIALRFPEILPLPRSPNSENDRSAARSP